MRKFVFVFGLLLLGACSSDLTLPPKIDGIVAPVPGNFMVSTTDAVVYDLSWTTSDATVTSYYNLYIFNPFTGTTEMFDSTTTTAVQVNTTTPTPGIVFGVSAVSIDNLESGPVFSAAE